MSQPISYDPSAFDLYIFDCEGEPIFYQYGFSNGIRRSFGDTPSLSIGKWYAVVLASYTIQYIQHLFDSISGRVVTNGKISGGDWILLHPMHANKQPAYFFYIRATSRENLTISAFDLVFGGRTKTKLAYRIPEICLQTNSDSRTYFNFQPSYKKFKFPNRQML